MEHLSWKQAIWLARGAALGSFLRRRVEALRAILGQLRVIRLGRRRLHEG
jgi:hypothetical protein